MRGRGGIGRRSGLKIRFPLEVRVRVPPSAPVALALCLAASTLTGCSLFGDSGPVRVAAIGALNRDQNRAPSPLSLPNRLFLDATAGGLVGFSSDGQVEAGLAERWTVIEGGRSYIFRIREARWSNGRRVRTEEVARILQRLIASPRLRSTLRGEFRSVRDIRAMTGSVIEIRLTRPQPDLLDLLAQPDMAILRNGEGWGPWSPVWTGGSAALVPIPEMGSAAADADEEMEPAVILWGAEASNAVAQFDEGDVAAVFGGRFQDWPLVAAAGIPDNAVQIDPVDGVFGLAVVDENGLLSSMAGRNAVGMAIDRAALAEALNVPGWVPRITARRAGSIAPVYPSWVDLSPAERRERAGATVRAWSAAANDGSPPVLRIALPPGPGARILFARINADLAAVGIRSRRVPLSEDADLRLIDDIAPSSDPAWYARRLGCGRGLGCAEELERQLATIDTVISTEARTSAIGVAEETIIGHGGFIPLGNPVRWSLVRPGLVGVRPNPRGRHSLIRLREIPD